MNELSLAVILAAGKGTRMRSALPKVMHLVGGRPMIAHVLAAVREAGVGSVALVVGEESAWAARVAGDAEVFVQAPPLGTAHAVLAAEGAVRPEHEAVVVLFGDNPLITAASVDRMLRRVHGGADVAVLAFRTEEPRGYGRVLLDAAGKVRAIREERDATDEERAVDLCNSGILALRTGAPLELLRAIEANNAKGEFYLTDIVGLAHARGMNIVWEEAPFAEVMGVDDRPRLVTAEAEFQRRARARALLTANLPAPDTVIFSWDTVLEEDVMVEPYVVFGPGVRVEAGATVRAFSHLEGTTVAAGAVVGPYARLRPGTAVGPDARVGNFVELKAATLGAGAKVNHLSYVGDAGVGAGANVGAGTITCNYDGVHKHRTDIGEGAFIGSNSALVAPVTVGPRATVGAGSVITEDVPADALALGRGRQVNKADRSPARAKEGAG